MTQRAAADKMGISYVHLCNVERGTNWPSWVLLHKIGDLYDVEFEIGVRGGE